jgi:hypothetical protein
VWNVLLISPGLSALAEWTDEQEGAQPHFSLLVRRNNKMVKGIVRLKDLHKNQ